LFGETLKNIALYCHMEELNNHKVPKIVAYFSSASTTGSIKSQTVI